MGPGAIPGVTAELVNPFERAVSSGQRNEFVHLLTWRTVTEGLPRSVRGTTLDAAEIGSGGP